MAFQFCDSMINQYWQQGYVVFRKILPASLLRDMRPEADKARDLAHELHGPQAQRLQPLVKYPDRVNYKPFQDYTELPELIDAIQRLLNPARASPNGHYQHWEEGVMGLLVEPLHRPRHHGWHRDWVSNYSLEEQRSPERINEFIAGWHKTFRGNQVNCAIYPDDCLWYVPGSHLRHWDLPGEIQDFDYTNGEKNPIDEMEGSWAEIERASLEKAEAFPNAICLRLDPGDFAVYRSSAWHTGVYLPYHPRATIHDSIKYVWE